MLTINQEPSGDITFETVDGLESVRQRVRQRLLFQRGEYYVNELDGVPYVGDVLRYQFEPGLAEAVITEAILAVEDVTGVRDVQITFDSRNRRITYQAEVLSRFGSTSANGSL